MQVGVVKFHEKVEINENDKSGFNAAKNAARNADVVVMVLGEDGFQSGEGRSRTEYWFTRRSTRIT